MADSYQQVSEAINAGLRDLLADSLHKWYGIQDMEGLSITAVSSEKGAEFKSGWTFTVNVDNTAPHQQELRITAAAILGVAAGLEKDSLSLSLSPQNGCALTGDINWVAHSVSDLLKKIGKPTIDANVDSTRSEVSEKIKRHQKRIAQQFKTAAGKADPAKLENIADEIVAKTKEILAIVAADNPKKGYAHRIEKLKNFMDVRDASLVLGIEGDSIFKPDWETECDKNGLPLSSTLTLQAVDGAEKDTLVADAFDITVKDIVLQFTRAHKYSTDSFSTRRTLEDAYEAAFNKEQPTANNKTLYQAQGKVVFCAFRAAQAVLREHAAADFKAIVESGNINDAIKAMNLDSIKLPQGVSRQAFNNIVQQATGRLLNEYANSASPWVQTPQGHANEYRAPLYPQGRSDERYPADLYSIRILVGQQFGNNDAAPEAKSVAEQTENAITAGLKTCYPGLDI